MYDHGPAGIKRCTHLLDWLREAYTHCTHGSKEWCEGHLSNAVEVIAAQDQEIERLQFVAQQERDKTVRKAVAFVLSHYEAGPMPFTPEPVDPETWWSKMQILPHDRNQLLPKSRAHFEARIKHWQALAVAALSQKEAR